MSARRYVKIKRKADGLITVLKLGAAVGSVYFLYRKWQTSKLEEQAQAAQAAMAANIMANEAGGITGATKPLVAPTLEPLPHQEPKILPYGHDRPDIVDTARKLVTPHVQNLVPNDIANDALDILSAQAKANAPAGGWASKIFG